jgi:hypothetical protein
LGDAVVTGGRGYGRLACRHCGITGHLRKFSASKKKMLTTGVGYSRRAALRREQCDMHAVCLTLFGNVRAVGLKSSRFLVTARRSTMPKAVSSLQFAQRSYFSEFSAEELVDGQGEPVKEQGVLG